MRSLRWRVALVAATCALGLGCAPVQHTDPNPPRNQFERDTRGKVQELPAREPMVTGDGASKEPSKNEPPPTH